MKAEGIATKQRVTFFSSEGEEMFSIVTDVGAEVDDETIARRERAWQMKWLVGSAFATAPSAAYFKVDFLTDVQMAVPA